MQLNLKANHKPVQEYYKTLKQMKQLSLSHEGAVAPQFTLRHGVWEAKDSKDDLAVEVKKKFTEGYPQDNILFQAPEWAILYQNGRLIAAADISNPDNLDDKAYILRLIKQVVTVSLETVEIVNNLPPLDIIDM